MSKEQQHTHGFKSPQGYFNNLEEDLSLRMSESDIPEETGLGIPENYFDRIEENVMELLNREESKSKVISLWSRNKVWYALAVAASVILGWVLFVPFEKNEFNQLPITEVEQYINNGELDLEIYDMAQLLTETEIDELTGSIKFDEAHLETYLMDHLDESTLITE